MSDRARQAADEIYLMPGLSAYETVDEFIDRIAAIISRHYPEPKPEAVPAVDAKLIELLDQARRHIITDDEREAQRQSWVRGEMGMKESTTRFPEPGAGAGEDQTDKLRAELARVTGERDAAEKALREREERIDALLASRYAATTKEDK